MSEEVAQYADDLRGTMRSRLEKIGRDMESRAWNSRPWNDITHKAEEGLYHKIVDDGNRVRILLGHGVYYGKYLELKNNGRFATVRPTMEHYYPIIMDAMREMMS
jgi:hypothetical protein